MFLPLLTGIGLSASAGLNAYLPLIVIALADRVQGGDLLSDPYEFLSSIPGIAVLLVLVTVELVLDKAPFYRWNDVLQSIVRPAAGALAAMAATSETDLNPVVALLVGLVVAGVVHTGKGAFRRRFAPSIRKMLVPAFSLGEDLYVAIVAPVALLFPVAVPVLLLPLAGAVGWAMTRPPVTVDPPRPVRPDAPDPAPTEAVETDAPPVVRSAGHHHSVPAAVAEVPAEKQRDANVVGPANRRD